MGVSGCECVTVRVSWVDGLVYLPRSREGVSLGVLYPLVFFASFILLRLAFL